MVETTWVRWFRDGVGATAPAAAAATSAYLVGSGIGAWWAVRRLSSVRRRAAAMRLYASIEGVAALGAATIPLLLAVFGTAETLLYTSFDHAPEALRVVRFAVALLVALPASAAYGAAFPVIAAASVSNPGRLGSSGAALHAANVGGAAMGVVIATWWGPPRIGVYGTYGVGLGLAVLAGAGAWLASRRQPDAGTAPPPSSDHDPSPPPIGSAEATAAVSGFSVSSGQVLLVQALAFVSDQSVVAFGAMLLVVLVSLSAGAGCVSWIYRRSDASGHFVAAGALLASAVGLAWIPTLLFRVTSDLQSHSPILATAAVVAGPTFLVLGFVWPATFEMTRPKGRAATATGVGAGAGIRIGRLSVANTAGALLGGVSTPFLVMPLVGPWSGFLVPAAACGLAGSLLLASPTHASRRRRITLAGGLGAAVLLATPWSLPLTTVEPGAEVLFEETSAAGVVSVVERQGQRLIRVDNHYVLGGTGEQVHEERQGHVPLLLHPNPERVAFVGSATGITAGAALSHDVEQLTLVEIVPDVARAATEHFSTTNRGVYLDPRTRVILDDARNFLRRTPETFDVVVSDLFVPWRAGAGALYSREHFAAMRARLRPGGLVAQWIPLYQFSEPEFDVVVATFTDVFPTAAVFRGDFYGSFPIVALVGWKDDVAPEVDVARNTRELRRSGAEDRWVTRPDAFWALFVAPLAPYPEDAPRNSLAWPHIEFAAAAGHSGSSAPPLTHLAWIQKQQQLRERSETMALPYTSLSATAERARRGGDELQRGGAFFASGHEAEASQALGRAKTLLPRTVFSEAAPDPSAADAWPDPHRP